MKRPKFGKDEKSNLQFLKMFWKVFAVCMLKKWVVKLKQNHVSKNLISPHKIWSAVTYFSFGQFFWNFFLIVLVI
jgi:hypothetical protein